MKKLLPYIIGLLVLVLVIYVFVANNDQKNRDVSTRITLDKRDKNPYGAFVFHESLKKFFPNADFGINYNYPGDDQFFQDTLLNKLYVIHQAEFYPQDYEIDDLIAFIDQGNSVFISTFVYNEQLSRFTGAFARARNYRLYPLGSRASDTMRTILNSTFFNGTNAYTYPGLLMESFFEKTDGTISTILGWGDNGEPNLLHLKKGQGNLYIHLSPLSLSNYFLLYDKNIQYFEKIGSLFPASTPVVIWDEYFSRNRSRKNDKGWFSAIMKNDYFRAGILTALALLLIYTLTEFRRRQRVIPVMDRPKNDSLEFVKTMGLLYYERGDHTNLAHKMSAYFMEHIRSRYKIFTQNPDAEFITLLSYKSGVSESLIKDIVAQINRINNKAIFSDTELIALQKNIETFHNNE